MEWISVKERLPKEKIGFIGTDGEIVFVAYWIEDCEKYQVGGWESCCYCGGSSNVSFHDKKDYTTKKVSHWMPLPEPPKEEGKTFVEWGGDVRCITSDGRNVNMADELNRLEREKNGS